MTISEKIRAAGWSYSPEMDRGGAHHDGWHSLYNPDLGTRADVATSVGVAEDDVRYEELRLDREAERCYDKTLPIIPVR